MGYSKPAIEAIRLEAHSELMDTSFGGQHKPGNPGGQTGDAKRNDFFDDEEEENNEPQTGLEW